MISALRQAAEAVLLNLQTLANDITPGQPVDGLWLVENMTLLRMGLEDDLQLTAQDCRSMKKPVLEMLVLDPTSGVEVTIERQDNGKYHLGMGAHWRNPWKDAVIDALVIQHTLTKEHETNPQKALATLVSYEVETALDPAVSSAAQGLIERGKVEAGYAILRPPGDYRTSAAMVLGEVMQERGRQEAKWGQQNHPNRPPNSNHNAPGTLVHGFPSSDSAKFICDAAHKSGNGSYGHIFVEEVCEALDEIDNETALREELIQVAAVTVAWVECIDRRRASATTEAP